MAMFNYQNQDGSPFAVTYETGNDRLGRSDAHLGVYGEDKTVSIQYDTPSIKGLPIKVRVDELNEQGEASVREIVSSYEDACTSELKELSSCLLEGKDIKTTAVDPLQDLKLFSRMYDKYDALQPS